MPARLASRLMPAAAAVMLGLGLVLSLVQLPSPGAARSAPAAGAIVAWR